MNIETLDLNLLKAFDALFRERHVGRAGARIGLAQPSMSNALNRLRAQFDDPLFTRGPDGMAPTQRAQALAPQVSKALAIVIEMLEPPQFDPMQADDQVTLAVSDLAVLRLAPLLLAFSAEFAPKLSFSFLPLDKRELVANLDAEAVMLAIGTFGNLPARFHRKVVMPDSFVCIARSDHPEIDDALTLDAFVHSGHALMTLNKDYTGAVDRALKRRGMSRRVVMTCAQFTLMPDVVANSDLIATVPKSLAPIARRAGCKILMPPLDLPSWESEMVWTQKTANSPLGRFILDATRKIEWQETARM